MKNSSRSDNNFGNIEFHYQQFFTVYISRLNTGTVKIKEMSHYGGVEVDYGTKAVITREQWSKISNALTYEFNRKLLQHGYHGGKWKTGTNYVEKLIGKELLVLVWAMEDTSDTKEIARIIENWKALKPEERWWLYSMANSSNDTPESKNTGWRKALKIALSDKKEMRGEAING